MRKWRHRGIREAWRGDIWMETWKKWGSKQCSSKEHTDRGNSKRKGPGANLSLEYSRNNKETSESGAEWARMRVMWVKTDEVRRDRIYINAVGQKKKEKCLPKVAKVTRLLLVSAELNSKTIGVFLLLVNLLNFLTGNNSKSTTSIIIETLPYESI